MTRTAWPTLFFVCVAALGGCSLERSVLGAQSGADTGVDAGPRDGSVDTGLDAGPPDDVGPVDADDAHVDPDTGMDGGPVDGGGALQLDLSTGGLFSRASEGSYWTHAPTDGTTAFLAWAPIDVRRMEDRGDGAGAMLLMEGSRTNYVLQSRDLTNAAWSAGAVAITADQQAGPDGTLADEVVARVNDYGPYQATASPPTTLQWASCYVRATSGTVSHQLLSIRNPHASLASAATFGTTWGRAGVAIRSEALPGGIMLVDARDELGFEGQMPTAQSVFIDLAQIEEGRFPSSAIRSGAAPTLRAADGLSYAVGQFPPSLLTRGFTITVAPDFASADIGASEGFPILGMGAETDGVLSLGWDGSGASVLVNEPGTTWTSHPATWSRGQMLTISVRPGMSFTLSGFTTGNGTYPLGGGPWTLGTLFVGRSGSPATFFGRLSRFVTAL